MAKSTAVAKVEKDDNAVVVLPDFMREDAGLGMEGVDRSSSSLPRISLMHPTSSPVTNGEAKSGNFYHKELGDLGDEIIVVPVYAETGYTLWDPSGENGAPLARGRKNDKGVWVWDPSHTKFEVMANGKKEVWDTKGSIAESKLTHWPKGNPPPPGKETLNFLFVLPDVGPHAFGVFSFSKSAFPVGGKLRDNIAFRGAGGPSFALKYKLTSTATTAKNGKKHLIPSFSFVGVNDSLDVYTGCKAIHSRVRETGLYGMAEDSDHSEGDDAVAQTEY
jgi:hypothetical protein